MSDGKNPVYCRVSVNGQSVRFSASLAVNPSQWDSVKGIIKGKSPEVLGYNELLMNLRIKLRDIYSNLVSTGEEITVNHVMDKFKGRESRGCKNLLEVYAHKIKHMTKLVGKDYSKSTLVKQQQMANAIKSFIKFQYDSYDIPLAKVNRGFVSDLEAFLRTERHMRLISINKVVQSLKSVIMFSIDHKWIEDNPFAGHRFRHPKTEVVFLTQDELKQIEDFVFVQARLNLVKHIFLFSVYTGLHFSDAMTLTKENLIKGQDGNLWIEFVRGKTGRLIRIPLFSKAKRLIEDFSTYPKIGDYLVPRFSNQKINSYLKEIGGIANISTPLTHKVARKTFGSLLLFYNTPIAVVSELMGHTSIQLTQKHYAKLEFRKLGEVIKKIDNLI